MSITRLSLMNDSEYAKILWSSVRKLRSLIEKREEAESEIAKIRQFMRAAVNMLPDNERQKMEKLLSLVDASDTLNRVGLTDAIKTVLERSPKRWFTVAQVRDALGDAGFDFSRYTSNPLSSVSTTLKRFKSFNMESKEIDGVTAYRWKDIKAALNSKARRAQIDSLLGALDFSDQHGWTTPTLGIPTEEPIVDAGADLDDSREKKG
jgi:hypothetical protein